MKQTLLEVSEIKRLNPILALKVFCREVLGVEIYHDNQENALLKGMEVMKIVKQAVMILKTMRFKQISNLLTTEMTIPSFLSFLILIMLLVLLSKK